MVVALVMLKEVTFPILPWLGKAFAISKGTRCYFHVLANLRDLDEFAHAVII